MAKRYQLVYAILLLWIWIWGVYHPGLSGEFQFDDLPNLSQMEVSGGIDDWRSFVSYSMSGFAGPTGRPVALATFAVQADSWPNDPFSFLAVNVSLHAANAALLLLIIWQILCRAQSEHVARNALPLSLFAAILWASHPFLVSTTLYVVQRMAILSTFFVLAAIALFLWLRPVLGGADHVRRWLAFGLGGLAIGVLGLLSVLSKENGVLLPVYLLLLEVLVVKHFWRLRRSTVVERYVLAVLVVLTIAVLAYLLTRIAQAELFEEVWKRSFTPLQALVTQPVVLLTYLYHLIVPKIGYAGLYHDNYPMVESLLGDPLALASFGVVFGGAWLAWRYRATVPLVSLAVLFFLSAHLVESLTFSLEPYFEHRNYLAAIFLFLPLFVFVDRCLVGWKKGVSLATMLLVPSVFAYAYADMWGDPLRMAIWSAHKSPYSERAVLVASEKLLSNGNVEQALSVLEDGAKRLPDSLPIWLTLASARQGVGLGSAEARDEASKALRKSDRDPHLTKISESLVDNYISGRSVALPSSYIFSLLGQMETDPRYQHRLMQSPIRINRLRLAVHLGRMELACRDAGYLLTQYRGPSVAMRIMSIYANEGYVMEASRFLDLAERRMTLGREDEFKSSNPISHAEIGRIRSNLSADRVQKNGRPVEMGCDIQGFFEDKDDGRQ